MRNYCTIEGCGSVVKGRGLCNKHFIRLKLTGTTDDGPRAPASLEERFWRQVSKGGPDDCWEWIGTKRQNGYGQIGLGGKGAKGISVHRYSCTLHHGEPFTGAHAMHSCDNPSCVNPAHLRWGTASENIKEAFDKGRKHPVIRLGITHGKAVLTNEKVIFIKAHKEMSHAQLGRLLGVSAGTIRAVRDGRTWKHIE